MMCVTHIMKGLHELMQCLQWYAPAHPKHCGLFLPVYDSVPCHNSRPCLSIHTLTHSGFLGARYALVQGAPGGKPVWKDRFFGTSCSCP